MAVINIKQKEIQAKIVYYGPGRCGKTTNLEYIHRAYTTRAKSELIKLDTNQGRTLFFDFLPLEIGTVKGFNLRIQLYSVPGQDRYESCRRIVLRGVDGIVFVADGMQICRQRNVESFQNLGASLAALNKTIFSLPMVVQCNKVDLAKMGIPVISLKTLRRDIGIRPHIPCLPASAVTGRNVIATLKKIILMTAGALEKEIIKGFSRRAAQRRQTKATPRMQMAPLMPMVQPAAS
jgi:hypothetical protein